MLDGDVILDATFDFEFHATLNFWDIQAYEWGRIQGKDVLHNWWLSGRYRSRDIRNITVEPSKKYTVSVIKKFPLDHLFRAEWIGEEEQKSTTNVLHTPTWGMLLRFAGQEVFRVATLCNNEIQIAVRDTLHTRTRICKSCEKVKTAQDREAARAAKGPFHCTACGGGDHFPQECLTSPDTAMQDRLARAEVTPTEKRRGWKEV